MASFLTVRDMVDNPGARKKPQRVGRGIASGWGKTSGRGGKGQTARTGVALNGFQGGQMPLTRRFPKRGFRNISRRRFVAVNLKLLQHALDHGRLSAQGVVDAMALKASGIIKNLHEGVRILGGGTLDQALHLQVAGITASARRQIEEKGGTCTLIEPFFPTGTLEVRTKVTPQGQRKRGGKSLDNGSDA